MCGAARLAAAVSLWLVLGVTSAYRVLLLPTPFQSHLNYFIPFGEALVKGGHKVHMILSSGSKGIDAITAKGIQPLLYEPADGVCQLATDAFHRAVSNTMLADPDLGCLAAIVAPAVSRECDNLLLDEVVLPAALNLDFHLVVVDGLFFARCLYLLPVRLGVPFVTLSTFQDVWPARTPALPSHVPFHYSPHSDTMTFSERLLNTVMNVVWTLKSRHSPALSPAVQRRYQHVLSRANFDELIYDSKLWFFNSDLALDYAKPTLPNVVHIGGMSVRPPAPLEPSLQHFMDSAEEGVVVVSFGSVITHIPPHINDKLIAAFAKLPWKFVWRHKDAASLDLPPNVLAMKWLPQNDLLAHNHTVAFVTHCGNNGQFEALHHQVPMVGLPIFADQPYNARHMEVRGYGRSVDIRTFSVTHLVEAITSVARGASYRTSVARGSRLLRSQPMTPGQRAVFWVEHVVQHGADHLRTSALHMPWYQYLLLDVILVVVLTLLVVVVLAFCALKFLLYEVKINLLKFSIKEKSL